ncbi:acyl-coenzyme A amino acid N-acyltransferase 1-like [Sphaerodactylus townsendi]|uniref:acyl-coenzyme A amino acid N-acyltransferase 1-like n=1 Tax=Sphaerodactylus townsendi TaxID=933632 RepID=UPI0020267473|nr:acyl-coenzyme A amino acid N-acyltransferase 1-like [Sphaerodactylus townsendi]
MDFPRCHRRLITMVQLMVTPEISLADSPVWIRAVGLTPSQPVTLHSSLIDEKNVKFEARAFYWANEAGEIDVKKASAVGGDYTGVCPMGLFWSLKPEKMFHRLIKRDVIGSPFHVQINLFGSFVMMPSEKDTPLATCTIERWFVTPGVEQIKIKDGQVRGSLFMPPGPGPFPGVIDMFGGGGGLIKFRASLLASKGFAVLALAYMAYEDLPQTLAEVNLEYFEEAAKLLLKHPKVRGPGLGVIGVSKGSEIALAMASFLVQIVAAVCINGTTTVNDAPLRFRDIYIPGVCYYPEKFLINSMGALDGHEIIGDPRDEAHQASVIPLEKAHGSVLFVVGEDDRGFNSKLFAELAIARAKKYGKNNCTLLSYPKAGHLIEPPCSPLCTCSWIPGYMKPTQWGGEMEPHAQAQEHSWKEIQKFLELHLGPAGSSNV